MFFFFLIIGRRLVFVYIKGLDFIINLVIRALALHASERSEYV